MNVDFNDNLSTGELKQTIAEMDLKIKQACPRVKRIFIEAESWNALTAKHQ